MSNELLETIDNLTSADSKTIEDILLFSQVMREYTFELDDLATDESNKKHLIQKIGEMFEYIHEFTN